MHQTLQHKINPNPNPNTDTNPRSPVVRFIVGSPLYVCAMSANSQSDALVAILLVMDAELQQTGASVSNFVGQVKLSCSCSVCESTCLADQTGSAVFL